MEGGAMAEIVTFDPSKEPFVRVEPEDDGFAVRFENCPKLTGLARSFPDGWVALRYAMNFALGEDIALLWRPGRLPLSPASQD